MKWIPVQLIVAGALACFVWDDYAQTYPSRYAIFISWALIFLGFIVTTSSLGWADIVKSQGYLPHSWWWSPYRFRLFAVIGLAGMLLTNLSHVAYYEWMATGVYPVLVWCVYSNETTRNAFFHSANSFKSRYQAS